VFVNNIPAWDNNKTARNQKPANQKPTNQQT